MKTVHQGMAELMKRVNALRTVPAQVIEQAHRSIMPLIPVYTGTYQGGVEMEIGKGYASLQLTEDALLSSARAHAGEIHSAMSMTPEEYVEDAYPTRIEAAGRPSDREPSGQAAWRNTVSVARELLVNQMLRASRGRM